MSAKVSFLAVSLAVVLLPWLVWQLRPVRRVAPLAVVQIIAGVLLGPSCLERVAPGVHAALFSPPVMAGLDGVSSLGVLLYVFVTGLHVDRRLLGQNGRRLAVVAAGSIAVPLLLGAVAGFLSVLPIGAPGASQRRCCWAQRPGGGCCMSFPARADPAATAASLRPSPSASP